jgi:nitrite reductase (NO-forming)
MPNQNLSEQEIKEYMEYFKWADANVKPQAKK